MNLLKYLLLFCAVIGLLAIYMMRGDDRAIAGYLPDGFKTRGQPVLRHTERGMWAACQLRIWNLHQSTVQKLRTQGIPYLVELDFAAKFSDNNRRRVTGWEALSGSAIENPIGFTGTSCHGFDRHSLVNYFKDETQAFYMRIGGESHTAFVAYPDSGRILVIFHSQ